MLLLMVRAGREISTFEGLERYDGNHHVPSLEGGGPQGSELPGAHNVKQISLIMTIFLMRHGETEWNVAGRKQGRGNSPLTENGRNQALECGWLINAQCTNIKRIFVSPLGRAQETCALVCSVLRQQPENIDTIEALAELNYGAWQGLTDEEIDTKYPGERSKRKTMHWEYVIPGGESYAKVERRISMWVNHEEIEGSLIIGHAMVNRVILGIYQSLKTSETLTLKHPHRQVYKLCAGSASVLVSD